jgi:protein-S-isoprenylcysteine O-methyltransferase Ste14
VSGAAIEMAWLGWFQVAGLALFLAIFMGRTVHLQARRHIQPIALSLGKKGLLGLVELALFIQVNIWAMFVLLYALPLRMEPPQWLFKYQLLDLWKLKLIGVVVVVLGLVIAILAVISLGDSWRLGLDDERPGQLVTHGIYAISRNPIYLFFDLYFTGTFLINGTLIFLIFALLTTANLHYQILQEEAFLARVHGASYDAYRARTARYFTLRRQPSRARSPEPRRET